MGLHTKQLLNLYGSAAISVKPTEKNPASRFHTVALSADQAQLEEGPPCSMRLHALVSVLCRRGLAVTAELRPTRVRHVQLQGLEVGLDLGLQDSVFLFLNP